MNEVSEKEKYVDVQELNTLLKDKKVYCQFYDILDFSHINKCEFAQYLRENAHILQYELLWITCLAEICTDFEEITNNIRISRRISRAAEYNGVTGEVIQSGEVFYTYCDGSTEAVEDAVLRQLDTGVVGKYYNYEQRFCDWCKKDSELLSGDFRSQYCKTLLQKCDVLICNPPADKVNEVIELCCEYDKEFVIISYDSSTNTEVFDTNIETDNNELYGAAYLQTLKTVEENESLGYEYRELDNYPCIEVSQTKFIPKDYDGVMAVPITALDKINLGPEYYFDFCAFRYDNEQGYRVIDRRDEEFGEIYKDGLITDAYLDGKRLYHRLCIRRTQRGENNDKL